MPLWTWSQQTNCGERVADSCEPWNWPLHYLTALRNSLVTQFYWNASDDWRWMWTCAAWFDLWMAQWNCCKNVSGPILINQYTTHIHTSKQVTSTLYFAVYVTKLNDTTLEHVEVQRRAYWWLHFNLIILTATVSWYACKRPFSRFRVRKKLTGLAKNSTS